MKNKVPNIVLFVYKRTKTKWRGVAYPLDLVFESTSCDKVKAMMVAKVEAYMATAKEYNYPDTWMNVPLSDMKDEVILNIVLNNNPHKYFPQIERKETRPITKKSSAGEAQNRSRVEIPFNVLGNLPSLVAC